jgi:RNA polymerase sigma-70 factor (ECF subfamily)
MNNQAPYNFADFYKKYYRKAFLFAKSYVHDHWDAEDIASEALIHFREIREQHEINHPLTFLLAIVKNKSIDYLRHELTRQEALATMSDTGLREINTRIITLEAFQPEEVYSEEIRTIVENTLNSLPAKTKEIFLMSRFRDMSKKEIASALGLTPKGVEYHLSVALKKLRITLKDYLPSFFFLFFP